MTSAQRVIKYLALGFAIFLIFSILSGIMFGISTVSNVFSDRDSDILEDLKDLNITGDNISVLDIDIKAANLVIKTGDKLKVETNNKYIKYDQDGNRIIIKEKRHNWFFKKNKSDLVVYIPENFVFDGVSINTGAGKIEVEEINTRILNIDFGAGKATINNLVVDEYAKIDGGAGEISILNGNINDLDLDVGVGKFTLNSKLTGNSEIDAGVGELNINLLGLLEDYKIRVEKGIGSAKLNNQDMKNERTYGTGVNSIDIDGGVGSINIKTK